MFVILWEFDVKRECEEMFTSGYSAAGAWARLFRADGKFRETRLWRDADKPLRSLTMDVWESRADYEHFLRENRRAYQELDSECAGWTNGERHVGSFDAEGH
jgi:heme-degrading monooxygenase HmoA